ncbi:influenza virus NS1A-binding protein homolog isoform X2 [Prunus avium]|uniref:Influenza virus NS1A-binding protein homolog isoform X2 n=1 Tax=Prunus avium TaxID=42229 RepID=A0A6P5THM7_PRUAV|nr:influenza virus NS1A-binding protein homolog isoform X2 [Prunus avium]
MGAGGKTQTFTTPHTQDLVPYGANMRNLRKNHLGGVIFGCNKLTMEECLLKQLFGLPAAHFLHVKNISPGLPLFLFNYSDRKLHGIYEAASHGQMNINPYGWTTDGSEKTQFPAQVQIRVRLQCQPLLESQFKPIIVDNYYNQRHFWFELDHAQTSKLVSLLASVVVTPSTLVRQNTSKWRKNLQALPSDDRIEESEGFEPLTSEAKHVNHSSSNLDATVSFGSNNSFKPQLDVKEAEQVEQELIYMKLKELALQSNLKNEGGNIEDRTVLNELTLEDTDNPMEQLGFEEKRGESPQSLSEQKSGESPGSLSVQKSGESPQSFSDNQAIIAKLVQEVEELKAFKAEQSMKIGYLEHKLAAMEIKHLKVCLKLESEPTPSMLESEPTPSMLESEPTPSMVHIDEKVAESCDMLPPDPNESMYLVGGYDGDSWLLALDAYYPFQDMIKSLRPMTSVRSYASVAQLNGDLYVIGGGNSHLWYDTVESYCPATDEWKLCPSLREKKGSLAAATTHNKIFAMGGGNGVDCFSDVEMLDLDVGRWIRTQSMLQKRFALAAVELNGVIYATGGYDGHSYLKSVDRFDPREHSWTKIASMDSNRGCHSLVVLNEKIYALGGFDGSAMVPSVEIYDPWLGSWMPGEPMNHCRGYSAAAVVKDAIYIIGGVKDGDSIAETVEYYKEGQGWREMTTRAISQRCFMSAIAFST